MIGIMATITLKYAVSPHLTMSFHTDGSVVLKWSLALTKGALDARLSPLTSGQNMPLVGRGVLCNVFLHRVHCTSPPSAMLVAS